MRGTFGERTQELERQVGSGRLRGSVEVDQVYAHYQNVHPEFHHPDGGEAFFMENSLYLYIEDYMRHLAANAITEEGSGIQDAMIDCMESMSAHIYQRAPWEFSDLRDSTHPTVTSDGETTYDRPPRVARLSSAELAEKGRLQRQLDPHRYDRDGAHVHKPHTSQVDHPEYRARKKKPQIDIPKGAGL